MEDKHDTVNNSVFYEFSSEARKYFFDPNQKSCPLQTKCLMNNIDISSGLIGSKLAVIDFFLGTSLGFLNQFCSNLQVK